MLRHNMNNKQLVDEIWEQAYEIFADMQISTMRNYSNVIKH